MDQVRLPISFRGQRDGVNELMGLITLEEC